MEYPEGICKSCEYLVRKIECLTIQRNALRETLKEVVAISDRKHDAWDKAKAAIKNAESK